MHTLERIRLGLKLMLAAAGLALLVVGDASPVRDRKDQVRRYTRAVEFDYLGWSTEALGVKFGQSALLAPGYLSDLDREQLVRDYLGQLSAASQVRSDLESALADPDVPDPQAAARALMLELAERRGRLAEHQPLAESVLQENVAAVLQDWGVGIAGTAWPPVSFRFSQLPLALIVSPRAVIRQEANVQLLPNLRLEDQIELERKVEAGLDVSALVVPIGGLSTYPTMIMEAWALDWLTETIAHEWVHHYLALRPLGFGYGASPEMRTINETVASIVGKEIGLEVLRRYYPEDLPAEPVSQSQAEVPVESASVDPSEFDFRAEMHETRVRVDELLAAAKIEEAEAYMEARRAVFWEHGYRHIRRLNQAYFAFHGAYADVPGGPAGEDPVGEAVRSLWDQIRDPVVFLRTVAWVTGFDALQELLQP